MDEALIRRPLGHQPVERPHEWPKRCAALWETPRVQNDDPAVPPVLAAIATIELEEVVAVVCHDRTPGRLRVLEELYVLETPKFSTLGHPFDIAVAVAKLLSHDGRDHLVEQQLHRVRLCSCQRSSAASASLSFRRIRSSISAGNSK